MKSLLILGIARSGTTPVQRISATMLPGFISVGETLAFDTVDPANKMVEYRRIKNVPRLAPPQYWGHIRDHLDEMKEDTVVKDVIQGPFMLKNMDWLLERFNILEV